MLSTSQWKVTTCVWYISLHSFTKVLISLEYVLRLVSDSNLSVTSSLSSSVLSCYGAVSDKIGSPVRKDGPRFVGRSTIYRSTNNAVYSCTFIRVRNSLLRSGFWKAEEYVLSYKNTFGQQAAVFTDFWPTFDVLESLQNCVFVVAIGKDAMKIITCDSFVRFEWFWDCTECLVYICITMAFR